MGEIFFGFRLEKPTNAKPLLDSLKVKSIFFADEVKFLGRGGFGETWYVRKEDRCVAVKIISNTNLSKKRLLREVESLQRCSTPHVVQLLKHGTIKYGAKSLPYLEFDYIPGGNLFDHLIDGQWPDYKNVMGLLSGLLEGLNNLHSNEMIHRDLKPENIILHNGEYSKPIIVDLGLAKIIDSDYTIYPALMGTSSYMAPEQIRGERPYKATDLWALGIILYLLLTHKHPFYPDWEHKLDIEEALDAICCGPPPLPPDVPEVLANFISKFLSPEPYKRGRTEQAIKILRGTIK